MENRARPKLLASKETLAFGDFLCYFGHQAISGSGSPIFMENSGSKSPNFEGHKSQKVKLPVESLDLTMEKGLFY